MNKFSRRQVLAAGGGVAAAAGLAGIGGYTALANDSASVPESPKFDLTVPSERLFWKKPLQDNPVMQVFSFDNVNRHVYVMQRTTGTEGVEGHLTVSKLDLDGELLEHMYLRGFGHGVGFGVVPHDDGVTMWTEADAQPSHGGDSSRARVVCRFEYTEGATFTKDDVELYEPVEGMRSASCSLDLEHNTIAVRHTFDGAGEMRVKLYDLDEFAAHNFDNPMADIGCSTVHPPEVTPQGYQHYGQHLYLFEGNPYDAPCDQDQDGSDDGNAHLSRINFNDESDHEKVLTRAGYSLNFREPEGLGLLEIDGQPRLAMGFASGCAPDRLANIYYKEDPPV